MPATGLQRKPILDRNHTDGAIYQVQAEACGIRLVSKTKHCNNKVSLSGTMLAKFLKQLKS
jgi:hypothetical protein